MSVSDEELMNEVLSKQIPEVTSTEDQNNTEVALDSSETLVQEPKIESVINTPVNPLAGKKLSFIPGDRNSLISQEEKEIANQAAQNQHITRTGENIFKNAELREGWIPVNKEQMGLRAYFYPEDWQFRIRPATVEAIRNWSNIDESNPFAVDDVLNEVLKSCLSIVTSQGQIPWGNVNSWDRLYFLLLIREFTFIDGSNKLNYDDDCPECDNPVTFELTSNSLLYEFSY